MNNPFYCLTVSLIGIQYGKNSFCSIHIQIVEYTKLSMAYAVFVGIMTGWASAALPKLRSNETHLLEHGAITDEQASWIPALKSLTFVLNIPIFGLIANKFGRKWPLNFLAIPLMVRTSTNNVKKRTSIQKCFNVVDYQLSWALIWCAKNIYYIYVARFLHGMVTAGVYSLSQFYFVEISHDSIRGMLGATVLVTGTVGNGKIIE